MAQLQKHGRLSLWGLGFEALPEHRKKAAEKEQLLYQGVVLITKNEVYGK